MRAVLRVLGGRGAFVAAGLFAAFVTSGCPAGGGAAGGAAAGGSAAGGEAAAAPTPPRITEVVRKRAKETFTSTCVTCHGDQGKGDGPGSVGLNPKPRAFGDPEWQKSVTDEHIEKTIAYGGAAVGKSAIMPAHPMFKDNPAMLGALREIVRSFNDKK